MATAADMVATIIADDTEVNNLRNAIVRSAIRADDAVQALGQAIARNDASVQAIAGAVAGDNTLSQAIVRAGAPLAPLVPVARPVGCGSVPETGRRHDVRPGFCYPDNADNDTCHGTILVNPNKIDTPIRIRDIFLRDSLFTDFYNNSSARDLANMIAPAHADFKIEGDANEFSYRRFFFTNDSDEKLSRYNANPDKEKTLVRLRYDVGFSYTRVGNTLRDELAGTGANAREVAERQEAFKLKTNYVTRGYWRLCPAFFTYRMIPLKKGYMTVYGYLKSRRRMSSVVFECTGIKKPTDPNGEDAVYLYTFVDGSNGTPVTHNTLIDKKIREQGDSFEAGDLPYDDDFFKFPKNDMGQQMKVKIAARYPDGILLFDYDGYFGPVPPFGTIVDAGKLHTGTEPRPNYPDQDIHREISRALNTQIANMGTAAGTYNAKTITLYGANRTIDNYPNLSDVIKGATGYIAMMDAIRTLVRNTLGNQAIGGNSRGSLRQIRHYNNNNKSIKRNKTKSKSKRRGRARAASMLKSAKQRFYRRGGGMGMSLGLGSSGPQPLQCNSPLVSQASPV